MNNPFAQPNAAAPVEQAPLIQPEIAAPAAFIQPETLTAQPESAVAAPVFNQEVAQNAVQTVAQTVSPAPFGGSMTATQPILPTTPSPELEPGQTILCKIPPAKFDAFVKVLGLLDDKNIINIQSSQICQSINGGTAILKTNIAGLVDNSSINLHILSPKKYIKAFKAIKGNNDIFIIDDPNNARFIVRTGNLKLWLPKQIEELQADASPPDLSEMTPIGTQVTIQKEERSQITSLMTDGNKINLLIQQGNMLGYSIPELLENNFAQYGNIEVSETKAELKLTSLAFLCIPTEGDSVLTLGSSRTGDHWLHTKITTSIIDIEVLEALVITQDDKLLIS